MKLDDEEWAKEFDEIRGELFKHKFFRVVLDEGHAIRNHRTKSALTPSTSLSLCSLKLTTTATSRQSMHKLDQHIPMAVARHSLAQLY